MVNAGDGAFYGPKIDFHVQGRPGPRSWQLGTIQLDYQMPQRFELDYVAADGAEHAPVMIHRAMLGSLERFLAILIEHTAGAFPLWLAPVQAMVLPVSEKFARVRARGGGELAAAGLRVELDEPQREAGLQDPRGPAPEGPVHAGRRRREQDDRAPSSVRLRSGEDLGAMPVADFVELVRDRSAARREHLIGRREDALGDIRSERQSEAGAWPGALRG